MTLDVREWNIVIKELERELSLVPFWSAEYKFIKPVLDYFKTEYRINELIREDCARFLIDNESSI